MESLSSERGGSILIVGTGALATLFAARLARAGCDITMLGRWADGIRSLRADGARLADGRGREDRYPVSVAEDPARCRPAKYAIVLVKSWQTARAARDLEACLGR